MHSRHTLGTATYVTASICMDCTACKSLRMACLPCPVHRLLAFEAGSCCLIQVAEQLLSKGLATIVRHRTDEERSAHYEALMEAEQACVSVSTGALCSSMQPWLVHTSVLHCVDITEGGQAVEHPLRIWQQEVFDTSVTTCSLLLCLAHQAGKKNKQGLYSSKEAPLHHVNDVSLPGTSARAKQYLPFLQRGRTAGVVDFVITGHRLKVSIVIQYPASTLGIPYIQ